MTTRKNIHALLVIAPVALACAATWAAPADKGGSSQVGGAGTEKSTIYSPVGKRDPFKAPAVTAFTRDVTAVNPLEKFAVEQLQLRAVLRGLGKAKAMFEDPDGKTHIIQEGDVIGRERATVSRILNSEVIVTERTFNYLGVESLYEKVLSLPPDKDVGQVQTGSGSGTTGPLRGPNSGGGASGASPAPSSRASEPAAPPSDGGTIRNNPGNKLVY